MSRSTDAHPSALGLLALLFFMWGFVTVLGDILVPHLKALFSLSAATAMFVQLSFFGAYFVVGVPAGWLIARIGYRAGIVVGLVVAASGALAFAASSWLSSYAAFLLALFVLAAGITVLQVAANPYVTLMGPPRTAASRLSLTQGINSLGTTLAPVVGAWLILDGAGAQGVRLPYLGIAGLLVALALVFARVRLPEIPTEARAVADRRSVWRHRRLRLGALAIFAYVGAEVGIGSMLVLFFGLPEVAAMPPAQAGYTVSFYWGAAMVGRLVGAGVQRHGSPRSVLGVAGGLAITMVVITVTVMGPLAVPTVLAVGLFNSIMFPTIFALAVDGLGEETSRGSGVLVMAIVGGALIPVAMGVLADAFGYRVALGSTTLAYGYIAWFAWRGAPTGCRATTTAASSRRGTSERRVCSCPMSTPHPHFRTCNLCEAMCGLRIEVQGDRVVSIRGDDDDPFSRGHVCPKAPALAQLHEDPDRLRQPMRRIGSEWKPVGWDEALDEAATRIHELQDRHGRDAMAAYLGNPNVHNLGAQVFGPRLLRRLRSKNVYSATSVDQLPHMLAAYLMFGHQLLLPIPDVDRTMLMVVLGANPLVSNGSLMSAPGMARRLRELQARGGRLVVIDPRRSETAARADQHLFIRPGTDALLLLGLLHVVFAEERVRLRHLEGVVDGVERLRSLVRGYSPDEVAPLTGIEASAITELARALADADAALCYGRIGTSVQPYGALCAWLINALNIVTGHLDHAGGVMFTTPAVDILDMPGGMGLSRGGFARWRSRVRGLPEFGGELPVATLADEILTAGKGQIRGLVTVAGNPVLSTPNGARLERGLRGLDFYVAVDLYLNETTRHAHLVLPPVSPLERSHYDLVFHTLAVRNTANYSPALLEPAATARHDWQILHGLTTRLSERRGGYSLGARLGDAALGRLGPERLVDLGLRMGPYGLRARGRDGLSLAALRRQPHGVDLGPLEPRLPGRLPKGRIDLVPTALVDDLVRLRAELVDGASEGVEPEHDTGRRRNPLQLIGRRQLRTNNSWMHNVPTLVSGKPRCTLLMHPDDAAARSVEEGDQVCVESRVGRVVAPVTITTDVMPGVVSLPHGFGHAREGMRMQVAQAHAGVSINDLTDELRIDALSGNAALSGVPVTVTAVG